MKTLNFEGIGWNKSDSNGDVGNCRIGATLKNLKGKEIYLELTGIKPHKYMPEKLKYYEIAGFVSHCFETKDHKTSYTDGLSELEKSIFEWSKENILKFVNTELDCDFENINIDENWCRFSLDGKNENDFHERKSS